MVSYLGLRGAWGSVLPPLSVSPYEIRSFLECERGSSQAMPGTGSLEQADIARSEGAKARWDSGHCFPAVLPSTWREAF